MPINYIHKYESRGKHIFEPNDACRQMGEQLLKFFSHVELPDCFYHYRSGGHVVALHEHLNNKHFFKIDVENFYYSIRRNRVGSALYHFGFPYARTFAKWSCVANPIVAGTYALPIGFVQSPLLASLVLLRSDVSGAIERALAAGVFVSVYFDDFIGSSNDKAALEAAYADILAACQAANFHPNLGKLTPPAEAILAFNCDLRNGFAGVSADRCAKFYAKSPSSDAIKSFEEYRALVASTNPPAA
jgi:hypothetical protein